MTREGLAAAGEVLPAPPERIVHLGLGAFHRAHQAWYTARADDAAEWGIVGFTGRSPAMADLLGAQGGVYTLVERRTDSDRFSHVGSVVAAVPGDRLDRFVAAVSAPTTSVVTLTITEAGYRLAPDDGPDLTDPEVAADLELLEDAFAGRTAAPPRTVPARLLLALGRRALLHGPPIAVVSCDNLPSNGRRLASVLLGLAEAVSPGLERAVADGVSFVSTSVDRITPRPDQELATAVRAATGWDDAAPVVTEPFSDWVLEGEFPAGRPAWETAGARFVADLEPYELRKLWLLNGAHLVLAFGGLSRGYATVAAAVADDDCRAAVERLWDDAEQLLPRHVDVPGYRASLLGRFGNPRIEHRLSQIAEDGLTKLRIRIVPVALQERRAGRPARGCAQGIASWIAALLRGIDLPDAGRADVRRALGEPEPGTALLSLASEPLAADQAFAATVSAAVRQWGTP
ncbi:mannitol dehydrogenase family protein [Jiangella aurantiaca]|uniref:Mannitol dehydrogenase family protein n=1 Tax=Jiangella aurantiaca TaxID=2530373 RepID=A0A4R5A9Q2_9ACTN|nr:mannitol dehydrogenase family protein [Jiangella aurantiaca]